MRRASLRDRCPRRATGFTLLEMVVVLAIVGIMGTITGLQMSRARETPPTPLAQVHAARRQAIESGRSVSLDIELAGEARTVLALPDGQLRGVEGLGLDPMAGRVPDA